MIPSGKHTKSYWTWPSRNSGFTHERWCWFSIVFCLPGRVTWGVFPMSSGQTCHVESPRPSFLSPSLPQRQRPVRARPVRALEEPSEVELPWWMGCMHWIWMVYFHGKTQSKMDDSWWFKWGASHFGKPPTILGYGFLWAIGKAMNHRIGRWDMYFWMALGQWRIWATPKWHFLVRKRMISHWIRWFFLAHSHTQQMMIWPFGSQISVVKSSKHVCSFNKIGTLPSNTFKEWVMLASNPLISSIDRQSFWFTIGMEIDQQRDGDSSRNAACWGCVQSPRVQHVEIQRNQGITETVSKHRRTTLVFCDRSIV